MEKVLIISLIAVLLWLLISMNSIIVYRFYRPTCPYCVSSQADWDKFKSHSMFSMVKCIDINTDDPSVYVKNMTDNFNITGVPAIWVVKPDGRRYIYEGDRTVDGFHSMVKRYST